MTLGFLILAKLCLYGLATFRLAVLVSDDKGPFHFISRFRSWLKREEQKKPILKKAHVAEGVSCLRCSSWHIAVAVAAYAHFRHELVTWVSTTIDVFLWGMALSGIAILFHRMFPER